MDWISLAVLAIIWAVLLVPSPRRASKPNPIKRYAVEHEEFRHPGRWILSPKRSGRFVGPGARARMRARTRRRQVAVFLLEAVALTGLIGLFPPFRGMLTVTAVLAGLLVLFLLAAWRVSAVSRASAAARSEEAGDTVFIPEEPRMMILPEAEPRVEETLSVRVAGRHAG